MNKWFFVLMDKGLDNDISAERHIFFSGFFRRRFFFDAFPCRKILDKQRVVVLHAAFLLKDVQYTEYKLCR
jgi:hypothetical protein